jgi:hypothetical protein
MRFTEQQRERVRELQSLGLSRKLAINIISQSSPDGINWERVTAIYPDIALTDLMTTTTCPRCGGTGLRWEAREVVGTCLDCFGQGQVGNLRHTLSPKPSSPVPSPLPDDGIPF